jgi:hypothetical protein
MQLLRMKPIDSPSAFKRGVAGADAGAPPLQDTTTSVPATTLTSR